MNIRPEGSGSRWEATSLSEVWEHLYKRRVPELVAQHSTVGGETLTFKELNARSNCLAAYLISKGVQPGEPILILTANTGSYIAMELAVQFVGGLSVVVSQDFSSAQLHQALQQTKPRFLLLTSYLLYDQHRGVLDRYVDEAGAEILCRTVSGIELTEQDRITMLQNAVEVGKVFWRENGAEVRAPREASQPGDACTIVYDRLPQRSWNETSRGAVLSHHNLLSAAHAAANVLGAKEGDTLLNILSPAHGLGRLAGYVLPLSLGMHLVQVHNLSGLLPSIQQHKPTYVTATPGLLRALRRTLTRAYAELGWWPRRTLRMATETAAKVLEHQLAETEPKGFLKAKHSYALRNVWHKLREEYLPGVQYFLSDGRGLTPDLMQFYELLGAPIISGFGMKETAGLLTLHDPQLRRSNTLGPVLACAKARVQSGGQITVAEGTQTGGPGKLEVQGDVVMLGYWDGKQPKPNTGWLDTGLQARVQQGHLVVQ